jgi:hypothetical protein
MALPPTRLRSRFNRMRPRQRGSDKRSSDYRVCSGGGLRRRGFGRELVLRPEVKIAGVVALR